MANIDSWLARKYSILGEQADTAQRTGAAQAGLLGAQAGVLPGQAAAQEAQQRAQAQLLGTQASVLPGQAAAQEAQQYGAAAQGRGLGGYYGTLGSLFPSQLGSENALRSAQARDEDANADSSRYLYGTYSKGTVKVPGKGSGKVDTQPAVLAPGEAVLNKAAAEHLGRDTISLLNALGRQKMGMTDPNPSQPNGGAMATDQGTTQGYAGGISDFIGNAVGALARSPVGDAVRNMTGPYSATGANPWMSSRGDFQAEPAPARAGAPSGGRGDLGAPSKTETLGRPRYAKGTSKVPDKKDSKAVPSKPMPAIVAKGGNKAGPNRDTKKAPAKGKVPNGIGGLSPGVLQAILQMGGGGGMGMPGGGQPPMPMAMPMTAPPQMPMR